MNALKYFLILAFLALTQLGEVNAQNLNTLDDIRGYALENSTEYKQALLDVLVARNNQEGIIKLDETSFSFSADYKEDDSLSSGTGNTVSAAAGINLPLIDQLALSATVSDDYSGSVGLSFSPLYHSDDRQQLDISYEKALLYAQEMAVKTENEALSAALNWMTARQQVELQVEIVAVKEAVYKDEKIRYEAGESTLDDVRDDLMDWTEARTELSTRQTLLQARESLLLQSLSADLDTASIEVIALDLIRSELEELKGSVDPERTDSAGVYSVLSALKSVESSEEQYKNTWVFDPTLSFTGSVNLPDVTDLQGDSPGWEAGIELSFSLDDFQFQDKSISRMELEQAKLEAVQAEMESRLTLQQAVTSLENSEQNRILAELEEEQSAELYDESRFLLRTGAYSEAEVEDARLDYEQSVLNTYSMLVEEYLAWRDLLLYF
ncbi:MAG: TolC family protein [Spirochaetales bacterium]|nr:TolC family protein [Spirochaetales bacterium]